MSKIKPKPSYFDKYADNYEDLVSDQTDFFSKDRSYFSRHKSKILKQVWRGRLRQPEKILEFGCGVGLNLPFILEAFPKSRIYGSDISEQSLDKVREEQKNISCVSDRELDQQTFDLILISCVFHHIQPQDRERVMERVRNLLKPDGILCVVEHNPYNPVTRHLVNTCPFDEDAVLLSMRETCKMISGCANLRLHRKGYCLFFPESLHFLNALEPTLIHIPLGGQYFVSARRT